MTAIHEKTQISATISIFEREAIDEMAYMERLGIGNMIRLCVQEAALRRGIYLVPEEERLQTTVKQGVGPMKTRQCKPMLCPVVVETEDPRKLQYLVNEAIERALDNDERVELAKVTQSETSSDCAFFHITVILWFAHRDDIGGE